MQVLFNNVLEQDIIDLAENIRDVDREELRHLGPVDPETAIRFSVQTSRGFSAAAHDTNGNIIAIFGFSPISVLGSVGAPWMLGTPLVRKHMYTLISTSKNIVQHMLNEFDELTNNVWAGNKASIRYLKSLGFQFSQEKTNRVTGAKYLTFTMRAPNV